MAKITAMKGFIKLVGPVQELPNEKKTKIQYMIFHVPQYTDAFGEKKGREQQWLLQIIGDKIEKIKPQADWKDKKAEIDFYVESTCLEAKEEGKSDFYAVNNTLDAVRILP